MRKAIRRIRTYATIAAAVELIFLALALVAYYFDFASVSEIVPSPYLLAGAIVLLLLDFLLYWLSIASLSRVRSKSDLETATLVGSDIQEAYSFAKIGLLVIDEEKSVMWTNSLFKERQIDFIDQPLTAVNPLLVKLMDGPASQTVEVDIKGRIYSVKYVAESHLFIFHDVTDYENLLSYSRGQALALGVVMIDNYAERASEEEDTNDTLAKVRSEIGDYFREKGALLRRVSADTYFAVCNWTSLEKMQLDGFAVLEKVRSCQSGPSAPLTLSIGFAHDFPDAIRLNEMVSNAIDIALSRGGDQAVVSKYGSDLRFYGGKTAAFEATNKVKVRSVADSTLALIRSASSVMVMGHDEMDMDALGSCLGIKALCEYCSKACKIVYSPKQAEKKARIAFQEAFPKDVYDSLVISPSEALSSIKDSTLVFVVDVSRPSLTMCPALLEKAGKVVIIDHHRRGEEYVSKPVLNYVDPSASSASEMIAEMIHYATANPAIEIKPAYATIMLSGIFLDTNFFKNQSTGSRSFEAAEILKSFGADNAVADYYLKDEFEEYTLITKIISTMTTPYYGIVYCKTDGKYLVERSTLAKVANQLMQLKGINACFVIGKTEEKMVRISARSDGSVNVQLLCEKMGGGGHFTSAAASFNGQTVEQAEKTLLETLEEYLDSARIDITKEGDKQ